MKREDYISVDELFIMIAALVAFRSKDPSTQNGSVIVDGKNRIVSVGYNGFPRTNGKDNDGAFPWTRPEKYDHVIHSEPNAIMNSPIRDLDNCRLYLYSERGYLPCGPCATWIAQSGIKEVVCCYVTKKEKSDSGTYTWGPTQKTFQECGVKVREIEKPIELFHSFSDRFLKEADKILKELNDVGEKKDVCNS